MLPAESPASGRAAAGYATLRQPRGGDKHWGQMGGAEQAAVMALGWTAASWDAGDEGPLQGAWEDLGTAQWWAADVLGYKSTEFGRASLVANMKAAADEEELGLSLESADSEESVVCPNATEKLDRWLTDRDTSEPTLLLRAAQLLLTRRSSGSAWRRPTRQRSPWSARTRRRSSTAYSRTATRASRRCSSAWRSCRAGC